MRWGLAIAGGGLAAQRTIETLRARGFDERIAIACAEPWPPYDRPPLSKEALTGELVPERLAFRDAGWYAANDVELLLGRRAVGLDVARRALELEGDRTLRYRRLLIATGAEPRRPAAFHGLPGAHVLRTLDDARALRAGLRPGARLAIVGAGFIGQEVAAAARTLGADVTLVEALDAPLANVVGPRLGHWFAGLHRRHGVEVVLGAAVEHALADPARGVLLGLADGRRIACDTVVVGTGVAPATAWLAGTPLAGDRVTVDERGRTSVPGVWAAGDVAGGAHWEHAARQGSAVARDVLGLPAAPAAPASFWSDQYGVRIHFLGSARGADGVAVDGDLEGDDFEALLLRRSVPVGVLLVNRPAALPVARRLLQAASPTNERNIA